MLNVASGSLPLPRPLAHYVRSLGLELPLEAMGRATFAAHSGCITELAEDDRFGNRTLQSLAAVDHLGDA